MKKIRIQKIKILRHFLFVFLTMGVVSSLWAQAADITSITGITLNPPSPSPGQTVTVNWTYSEASAYNSPDFVILVSNVPTLQNAGAAGQSIVIGDGCAPGSAVNGGGCNIGSNVAAGTNTYSYNAVIPAGLSPGTWYVIVVMQDYGVYINTGSTQFQQQANTSFIVPLPQKTSFTITKSAEATTAAPDGLILFKIDYSFVNTTSFVITDTVPSNTTFVALSPGGVPSGNNLTWNLIRSTKPCGSGGSSSRISTGKS